MSDPVNYEYTKIPILIYNYAQIIDVNSINNKSSTTTTKVGTIDVEC